jgi:hypothetical protein
MKLISRLLLLVLFAPVLICNISAQSIFSENFQQGIPNTFTLYNNDNKLPAPAVSFVTDAWIGYEVGTGTRDSVAASTSLYSPGAVADDWLVTPAINLTDGTILTWKAQASDSSMKDGYEVRISTTDRLTTSFSTILFATNGENAVRTTRTLDLSSYSGETIYIAFRNTSFNKGLLYIDDIDISLKPAFDLTFNHTETPTYYFRIPRAHRSALNFGCILVNNGNNPIPSSKTYLQVFRNNTLVKVDSANAGLILPSLVQSLSFSSYTPKDTGTYRVVYCISSAVADANKANDTVIYSFMLTDTIYARDKGNTTGTFSTGFASAEAGVVFHLQYAAKVKAGWMQVKGGNIGQETKFRLYSFNNNRPGILVDSTAGYAITATDSIQGKDIQLAFVSGNTLPAGKYLLVATEKTNKNLGIVTTSDIKEPATHWFRYSGNPFSGWERGEKFDSIIGTDRFTRPLMLRMIMESACKIQPAFNFVVTPTCTNTGKITTAFTSPNPGVYTYNWSTGNFGSSLSNLVPGNYVLSVTDGFGCTYSNLAQVNTVPITATMSIFDVMCKGAKDGSAEVNPVGGNGNYQYVWSTTPAQHNKVATGLGKGTYTVTISDGSCTTTALAPVFELNPAIVVTTIYKKNASSNTAGDGSLIVNATGGQVPYTYLWDDSTTNNSLNNIPNAKYCLIVTDDLGCSASYCDTVGGNWTSVEEEANFDLIQIYPNPASDKITISSYGSNTQLSGFTIVNGMGQVVLHSIPLSNNTQTIDVQDFAEGVYFIRLNLVDGKVKTHILSIAR